MARGVVLTTTRACKLIWELGASARSDPMFIYCSSGTGMLAANLTCLVTVHGSLFPEDAPRAHVIAETRIPNPITKTTLQCAHVLVRDDALRTGQKHQYLSWRISEQFPPSWRTTSIDTRTPPKPWVRRVNLKMSQLYHASSRGDISTASCSKHLVYLFYCHNNM